MPHTSRHWLVGVLAAVLASSALLVPTLTSAFDARRAPGPAAAPLDAPAIPDGEFVTRSGTSLELNGEPYRFAGINIYNANSDGWCGYEMRSPGRLAAALGTLDPGTNAIRAWFTQPLSQNAAGTARDWSAFDNTLAQARARGIRVIVTLSNHWGECGNRVATGTKSPDWYQSGYMAVEPGQLTSYLDYVGEVVSRYRNDPTILFWQLMNEAETKDLVTGDCAAGGETILHDFAADVSSVIKTVDNNHLVSLGTLGGPQCGPHREGFRTVHDVPTVDVCEYHDYSPTEALPTFNYGDGYDNGLVSRVAICHDLGKPIFVGESGIPRSVGLASRAMQFQAKIRAQLGAGVVGFLAWNYADASEELDATYDVRPGDPALAELRVQAVYITLTTPAEGATYARGAAVYADYECSLAGYGFLQCAGTAGNGALVDTWTTGPRSFSVSGDDGFGNVTEVVHAYEVLAGDPRLTGSKLSALGFFGGSYGHVDVVASCDPSGTSTVSWMSTGPAGGPDGAGPFPGTFTETGTAVFGPQYNAPFEGVAYGDVISFSSAFRIESSVGTVTGTKALAIPGYHGGYCVTPSPGSPFSGANLRMINAVAYDATIIGPDGAASRDTGVSTDFLYFGCAAMCDDAYESRLVTDGSSSDPDVDGDGVDDRIDVGPGAFDDGAGTTGSIVDPSGSTVFVGLDPAGVRITVVGGVTGATFQICGFTVLLAPGTEVVEMCGSITTNVVSGQAQILLGGGLVKVTIPAGATGLVRENPDGSFSVESQSGSGVIIIVVDGLTTTIQPGANLHIEAWDFDGFASPVDAPPVVNVGRAGAAVPLKWRLLDASGAPVSDLAAASVRVVGIACASGASTDLMGEVASGGSGFQNLGDGYYQFNWKTPKAFARSCKVLHLNIGDGVKHTALFAFK